MDKLSKDEIVGYLFLFEMLTENLKMVLNYQAPAFDRSSN